MNKSEIRANILHTRDAIPPAEKIEKDRKIHISFQNTSDYTESKKILIYVSFGSEIDTHRLIVNALDAGKTVCVPITERKTHTITPSQILSMDELEPGEYGILAPKPDKIRPVPGEIIDLTLVPGLAFDRNGYRIGYGGGYYDRFFEKYPHGKKIALCYDFQLQDSIPLNSFDIPVDILITESKLIRYQQKEEI